LAEQHDNAGAFEASRRRIFGLAYRMLGSRSDAEDLVQDTYLRWHTTQQAAVDNPEAWLVTTATRLAIDRLRRRKTEREAYRGPWLPEPIVEDGPERLLELSSDLSMAMLTVLETLAPEERAAFLLHDVFDVDYSRIAGILGRTEPACRQIVHRARERVRGGRRRFAGSEPDKRALLERFVAAMEASDEQALVDLFRPDATWTADSGGKTAASPQPLVGVQRIVRLVLGLRRRWWAHLQIVATTVNGEPGLILRDGGRTVAVMAIETDEARIRSVFAVLNPDKLPAPDNL
jgi:RNA polymerase sigma-70 factor (ECF subfamily)